MLISTQRSLLYLLLIWNCQILVQKLDENGIEDHLRILAGMLPPIQKTTPPAQKLVQLLNYIGSISHKNPDVCNRLISMKVINNLAKQSKDSSQIEMSVDFVLFFKSVFEICKFHIILKEFKCFSIIWFMLKWSYWYFVGS